MNLGVIFCAGLLPVILIGQESPQLVKVEHKVHSQKPTSKLWVQDCASGAFMPSVNV